MKVVREEISPGPGGDALLGHRRGHQIGQRQRLRLGASIWSNDLRRVQHLTRRLRSGTVWVNTHNFIDPNMPFGGVKQSGIGREAVAPASRAIPS